MKKVALLLLVAVCLGAGGVKAEDTAANAAPRAKVERCPPAPGSRLATAPNAAGHCDQTAPSARSYTREDIERTGEIDLDRALEKLDPAFTRGR